MLVGFIYLNIYFHVETEPLKLIYLQLWCRKNQKMAPKKYQQTHSFGRGVNIFSAGFHPEFTGKLSTSFCAFSPLFFFLKWMPGELQSLIIFLHLKLIRFVLPLPPLPPTSPLPYTSSSLQLMRRNQCIALSGILLLKWQESLVTKVICCLIEIFSQLIAMQTFSRNAVVEPSIDCPPTPSFFLLSLQINCTLLYSFYQKRKIN